MKKFISLLLALVMALSVSFFAFAKTEYLYASDIISKKSDFHLIAHRGLNAFAPENSLAAIKLAGKYGYWGCEFDISPTSDGKWVLIHNSTIDSTTNGSGTVSKMTYEQISAYTIDKGNGLSEYPNEKIPELSAALDMCKKYGMHPVIELKSGTTAQIKSLCSSLKKRSDKSNFIFTSFSTEYLRIVRENMPTATLWLLTLDLTDLAIVLCKSLKIECIDNQSILTSESDIKKIQSYGFTPAVWTVNSVEKMEQLYSYGVKYVTTDEVLPIASDSEKELVETDSLIEKVVIMFRMLIDSVLRVFRSVITTL